MRILDVQVLEWLRVLEWLQVKSAATGVDGHTTIWSFTGFSPNHPPPEWGEDEQQKLPVWSPPTQKEKPIQQLGSK